MSPKPFDNDVPPLIGGVDDDPVEHPVELFGVDPMGSFDLAVEAWSGRFDVDMSDSPVKDVIVKLGLELSSVVSLDGLDPEGESL